MAAYDHCRAALEQHEHVLARLPNVVGLGIVELQAGGSNDGGHALAVYVDRKLARSELAAADLAPAAVGVSVDGRRVDVEVRVIELGEVSLQ